jgi:hypothetical protein
MPVARLLGGHPAGADQLLLAGDQVRNLQLSGHDIEVAFAILPVLRDRPADRQGLLAHADANGGVGRLRRGIRRGGGGRRRGQRQGPRRRQRRG